jgi:hypothetical protein
MLIIQYNNTKEGAYIPFSLSKAKLSNLDLIILSTCIKSNKCLNYLRTRAYLLKVRYNVQVRSVMNAFIQMAAQQFPKYFKIYVLAPSSCLFFLHALARLMRCGCSCISPSCESNSLISLTLVESAISSELHLSKDFSIS